MIFLCLCLSFWCFLSFSFFWGDVYRSAEVCGRFLVGISDEKTNKTKHFLLKMEKKKKEKKKKGGGAQFKRIFICPFRVV